MPGTLNILLQHPQFFRRFPQLKQPLLLLPDLLLNLPKLFLLPGQLPHAAGNQILEFLRECLSLLAVDEFRQLVRKPDAPDVYLIILFSQEVYFSAPYSHAFLPV